MEQTSAITGFFLCFPLFFYPLCADILALHSFTSPLNSANFLTFSSSERTPPCQNGEILFRKLFSEPSKPWKFRQIPNTCRQCYSIRNVSPGIVFAPQAFGFFSYPPKPCKHRLPKSSLPPLCQHVPHVRNLSRLFALAGFIIQKFLCIKAKAHRYCSPLLPL